MSAADARALSNYKKKRGVVRTSVTRLCTRLAGLEGPDAARRLTTTLQTLAAEFRVHHYAIIELTDDETALENEQDLLDKHDDEIAQLTTRVEKLVAACLSLDSNQPKIALKRLKHLDKGLDTIFGGISSLPSGDDGICLLQQYEVQLSEFKTEFSDIHRGLLSFDIEDGSELSGSLARIEK